MRFVTKNLNFHRVSFHFSQNILRIAARNFYIEYNVITSCIVDKAPSFMEELFKGINKIQCELANNFIIDRFSAIKYLVFNWTNFQ